MARRLGRRKEKRIDKVVLKEHAGEQTGLNRRAAIYLSKFYNKGIISELGSMAARGKESDIYLARAGNADIVIDEELVIMKFFRIENSSFVNMVDYITGDPRFKRIGSTKSEIVETWCRKEFGNLEMAERAGVSAPRPYMFNGNILAMQYISEGGGIAPQLGNTRLGNPKEVLDEIFENVGKLYTVRLVHADLSEYNILMKDGHPCFIDFGQAVVTRHPHADEFLRRDIWNVANYFKKAYGIDSGADKVYREVTGNP
jgi:RIO kinase 1